MRLNPRFAPVVGACALLVVATHAWAAQAADPSAKAIVSSGTARPAPELSSAQRAALATKDALRRNEEARFARHELPAKPAAIRSTAPAGISVDVVSRKPAPTEEKPRATSARVVVTNLDRDRLEATLAILRSAMGPERAAEFGIGKAQLRSAPRPASPGARKPASDRSSASGVRP